MNYSIHPSALVESEKIGSGTRIWAFVHILPQARIGKNANICDYCFIENDVEIGDNVTVKSGVYLWDGIKIENNVMIGPAAAFTNDRYHRSKNKNFKFERILIKKGASIGANSTVLPGLEVGTYALVGAGSVVTKDVPNFALVYGNPARLHGYICVCGEKLKFIKDQAICNCKRRYTISSSVVRLETHE